MGQNIIFYQELAVANEFEDDLDLNTLNDEELTEQVHDDLYNGLREEVVEAIAFLPCARLIAAR